MIRPTHTHARAEEYARPGGPWDVPVLDAALTPLRDEVVARLAGGLRAAGVRRGDAVCWQRPNGEDVVDLYRACWRLGAVAVPIHHQAGAGDVARILDEVQPALVLDEGQAPDGPAVARTSVDVARDDVAVVLFTSGSSGTPKGVIHTHQALVYKARLMAEVHGLSTDDATLMPAPLAHISGLLNGVLLPGIVPFRVRFMARWDPEVAVDLIERERITFMIGPPTFFVSLMSAPSFSTEAMRSLRLVSSGGAGVTPAFVESARVALGAEVKRTYGSTEAPTITTSRADDDPARAAATDGRPTGDVELRIDPANGELLVRAPELFCGYTDPARNDGAFTEDGFFRTGDLAAIDEDGWLTIVGRLKDIIIRGGENIAAAEVEGALEAHPDVTHAAAVGAPDDRLGERVVAYVTVRPGASFDLDTCRSWFAERGVARFKTPERVVVVDELPVLSAGKIDRATLRDRAADSFLR